MWRNRLDQVEVGVDDKDVVRTVLTLEPSKVKFEYLGHYQEPLALLSRDYRIGTLGPIIDEIVKLLEVNGTGLDVLHCISKCLSESVLLLSQVLVKVCNGLLGESNGILHGLDMIINRAQVESSSADLPTRPLASHSLRIFA